MPKMSEKTLVGRLKEAAEYDYRDHVDMYLGTMQVHREVVDALKKLAAAAANRIEELEAAKLIPDHTGCPWCDTSTEQPEWTYCPFCGRRLPAEALEIVDIEEGGVEVHQNGISIAWFRSSSKTFDLRQAKRLVEDGSDCVSPKDSCAVRLTYCT